ncbi:hypothetical protein CQA66_04780 [Helicobacter aurati]|uniref:Solute-binding protein family 3/N-terminal domain-containing protein n=1 Tax=Helicobacter aurati TaxID=137778 RepID=A0A3D8J570_9HELI|nr:ABC transporter substrate-binding protein [Helicobacter aurati]RDU72380.1 hypothetical protein CQA66_04780 [Helicobacter aurati]
MQNQGIRDTNGKLKYRTFLDVLRTAIPSHIHRILTQKSMKFVRAIVVKKVIVASGITKMRKNIKEYRAYLSFLQSTFLAAFACFFALSVGANSLLAAQNPSNPSTNKAQRTQGLQVRIGTQSIPSSHALAIAKGFVQEEFSKLGATAVILNFDSGRDINNAFASKSIDLGFLGTTPFVIGALNGIPISVIWVDFISHESEGLVVRKGTFNNINELKGQKIAVSFGTSAHYALLQILNIHKISTKEVTLLDLSPNDIFAAWERGDINAACVWDLALSNLKNKTILFSDKDLADKGIILSDITAARNEFLEAYPEIASAYIKAVGRAYEYRIKEPQDSAKVLARFFKIPERIAQEQLSEVKAKPLSIKEVQSDMFGNSANNLANNLQSLAKFLYAQKLIRTLPDSQIFTRFLNASFLE